MMFLRALWRSRPGRIGAILSITTIATALVSTRWTPHDPTRIDPTRRWLGWTWSHPFGTDGSGKDILSQILAGARTSLAVVALSVILAGVVGLLLGLSGAVLPRTAGGAILRLVDVLIALPGVILALVLVAALEPSLVTVSLAIGLSAGVGLARVVHAEAATVLGRDYVLAARLAGSGTLRTTVRHVLPNIAPTVAVQLSIIAAFTVLSEASLSYLGLTPVATPSWGRMLQTLQQTVTIHPAALVMPAVAVIGATLGFNLLGDGIRDALDPRLRRHEGDSR